MRKLFDGVCFVKPGLPNTSQGWLAQFADLPALMYLLSLVFNWCNESALCGRKFPNCFLFQPSRTRFGELSPRACKLFKPAAIGQFF